MTIRHFKGDALHRFAQSTYVRTARSPWMAWARPGVQTNLAGPFSMMLSSRSFEGKRASYVITNRRQVPPDKLTRPWCVCIRVAQ